MYFAMQFVQSISNIARIFYLMFYIHMFVCVFMDSVVLLPRIARIFYLMFYIHMFVCVFMGSVVLYLVLLEYSI